MAQRSKKKNRRSIWAVSPQISNCGIQGFLYRLAIADHGSILGQCLALDNLERFPNLLTISTDDEGFREFFTADTPDYNENAVQLNPMEFHNEDSMFNRMRKRAAEQDLEEAIQIEISDEENENRNDAIQLLLHVGGNANDSDDELRPPVPPGSQNNTPIQRRSRRVTAGVNNSANNRDYI